MLVLYNVLKDNYNIVAHQLKMQGNLDAGYTWLDDMYRFIAAEFMQVV